MKENLYKSSSNYLQKKSATNIFDEIEALPMYSFANVSRFVEDTYSVITDCIKNEQVERLVQKAIKRKTTNVHKSHIAESNQELNNQTRESECNKKLNKSETKFQKCALIFLLILVLLNFFITKAIATHEFN